MDNSKEIMRDSDEEDIIECKCYILLCMAKNGKVYTDRVYKSSDLAEKRVKYLNLISGGRGIWSSVISELGK